MWHNSTSKLISSDVRVTPTQNYWENILTFCIFRQSLRMMTFWFRPSWLVEVSSQIASFLPPPCPDSFLSWCQILVSTTENRVMHGYSIQMIYIINYLQLNMNLQYSRWTHLNQSETTIWRALGMSNGGISWVYCTTPHGMEIFLRLFLSKQNYIITLYSLESKEGALL